MYMLICCGIFVYTHIQLGHSSCHRAATGTGGRDPGLAAGPLQEGTSLWKKLWKAVEKLEKSYGNMAVCQNLVPLVNIKIAGKWMFIPLKMVCIGIDP